MSTKPDIVGYPIFRVGKWNNMAFTADDLKAIADTFHMLRDVHQVPLKLGHNDEQPLKDGALALGWVGDVRFDAKKDALVADFESVPRIVKDLIRKKAFRTVSIELLMGAEYDGKKIPHLLDAVAILGATQPAVRALPDLNAFLASRSHGDVGGRRATFKGQADRKTFTSRNEPRGGSNMEEEEVQRRVNAQLAAAVAAAVAPYRTEVDGLRTELTTWKTKFSDEETKRITAETEAKTLKASFAAIEEASKKEKVKMARKSVTELLESAVKAKKITPAKRDSIAKFVNLEDDAAVLKIDVDSVSEMFSLSKEDKSIVNSGDESTANGGGGGHEDGDPNRKHKSVFDEVAHRIAMTRAKDATLTYAQAMNAVFTADKELHKEYLSTETPRDMRQASGGN